MNKITYNLCLIRFVEHQDLSIIIKEDSKKSYSKIRKGKICCKKRSNNIYPYFAKFVKTVVNNSII